jgi:hypothetical protein
MRDAHRDRILEQVLAEKQRQLMRALGECLVVENEKHGR